MKKFLVEIRENLSRCIIVEAENEDEAYDKVREAYYDDKIVLDSSDFTDVEIETLREADALDLEVHKELSPEKKEE